MMKEVGTVRRKVHVPHFPLSGNITQTSFLAVWLCKQKFYNGPHISNLYKLRHGTTRFPRNSL